MFRSKTFNRQKTMIVFLAVLFMMIGLTVRLVYLMVFCSEYYGKKATDLHERERTVKAARGKIIDATGTVLADNKTVCTISVIHSQIREPEQVIAVLSRELDLPEDWVRARVEKVSSIERIRANVEKETGDKIRACELAGVKVDEDYKRYYPFSTLASHVLGFTGGDNQGIIGLEVKYDSWLQGQNGKILTLTDARGVEISDAGERRLEPQDGNDLYVSLDYNIQMYAEQAAQKARTRKQAEQVSVLAMNPSNGEILAMVNVPEFDLNEPFALPDDMEGQAMTQEKKQEYLNAMWRNPCISDTYEPGSTFKVITTAAALEADVVHLEDSFYCPGYIVVEDRRIHCHKRTGHGAEDFTHGIMNSCNPVFIDVGLRIGADRFYDYFGRFGLLAKTGIDLPGEASTIMHKKDKIGQVELATISFGQSFQVTPIRLATTVSSIINGGRRITPHVGVCIKNKDGEVLETFSGEKDKPIVSEQTSQTVQYLLEKVVSEGSGKNAAIEGYAIGGKTATSQTLPRSAHRYISSFLGFAPADDPKILVMVLIHNPQGIYYGGTIAAPVAKEIFEDILPYLNIPYSGQTGVNKQAGQTQTDLAQ